VWQRNLIVVSEYNLCTILFRYVIEGHADNGRKAIGFLQVWYDSVRWIDNPSDLLVTAAIMPKSGPE
jgi:hypothetical protein